MLNDKQHVKNETQNIWSEQHHSGAVPAPTSTLGAGGAAGVYKWGPFTGKKFCRS